MNDKLMHQNDQLDSDRRKLLQGAVCVGAASFAPSVFANGLPTQAESALHGKLICSISNPIKTLVLHNPSDKPVVIEQLSKAAFMFDGSIVDCNTACASRAITIEPNQEVQVQFDRRKQIVTAQGADEFQRIQSKVTRLNDGTRVIPFSATLQDGVATIA